MDENNRPDNQEQRLSVSESEQPVETRMEHKPPTPKRRGGFLPSLLGAIVGGLLVWLLMSNVTGISQQQVDDVKKNDGNGQRFAIRANFF